MSLKVDRNKLERWIDDRFRESKRYQDDILVCSPFAQDRKFKLSISSKMACFHCWKSNESGPLWLLVCKIDNCSKREAIQKVYVTESVEDFEDKIAELKGRLVAKDEAKKLAKVDLPDCFTPITFMSKDETNRTILRYVVEQRGIDPTRWQMGYCSGGKYRNRLVIPFFGPKGELIYWIARAMGREEPKYLNSPKKDSADKSDVLFAADWELGRRTVHVVEGAFDAISLTEAGLTSVAVLGKVVLPGQAEMLREAGRVVLALDADSDGQGAISACAEVLVAHGIKNVLVVSPGCGCKDWNEMLVKLGREKLRKHVEETSRVWDFRAAVLLKLRSKLR